MPVAVDEHVPRGTRPPRRASPGRRRGWRARPRGETSSAISTNSIIIVSIGPAALAIVDGHDAPALDVRERPVVRLVMRDEPLRVRVDRVAGDG